jgi:plastocyanin
MEEKVYIVTLYKHEDLEQFYNEMSDYHLVMKRPTSRNTHYKMTEEQAEKLRQDPRVWDVQLPPKERGISIGKNIVNYNPYNFAITGGFNKGPTSASDDANWGLLHHGDESIGLGMKDLWGYPSGIQNYGGVNVDIFNDGKHVDVVICDDPVSTDCDEWISPTSGQTRFIQYDWYTQLNTLVGTIDDDSQTLPTGSYPNYFTNSVNTEYHGTHVAGTVAGQFYGWAREANIYSMQVLGNTSNTGTPVPDLLIFDYLRAFHRSKTVNPDTGIKNPTVTNHSWGYSYNLADILEKESLDLSDITAVNYRGTVYNSGNPNPSGWDWAGLEKDFGFGFAKMKINADNTATNADVEDAIKEGIVIVSSAGNNNFHCVADGDPDYYNTVTISGLGTVFYNRGSSPSNSGNTICVGALSSDRLLLRSTYSNFGPLIDIFAAGDNIVSAFSNAGYADSKYGGAPNYFYSISGTSMASPQVAGVLACVATGKERFTQEFARNYLRETASSNEMDFDTATGGNVPASTFDVTVVNVGFSYRATGGSDRLGSVSGLGFTVTLYVGDTINFNLSNVATNHPFYIRDQLTNTNVSTPSATGQGSTGNGTVSWTPNTAGTYRYICGIHPSMVGFIYVNNQPSITGTFADNSCQKGSPNLTLIGKNPREGVTGVISTQVGDRTNGFTFPRVSTFHRPAPKGLSKTLTLAVTNTGSTSYVFNGPDRATTHVDAADPAININQGDTLVFTFTISGSHPFWIKTIPNTGSANAVTTGTITNNGQQSLNLTWDTNGVTPGTYWYCCGTHWGSMQGQIIVT